MFGKIKFFVGLQIQQSKKGIYITQSKYIKEILKKFGMEDSKLVGTLMCTRLKLRKDDESKEVDQTLYRSMIEKLQYVVHTRPNIALAVGIVARFSAKPKENHMMVAKMILRYLKGTEDYGLWYKLGVNMDLKVLLMQIGQETLMIEKVQVEVHSFLGKDWYLGQVKRKIVHLNQQQNHNIL